MSCTAADQQPQSGTLNQACAQIIPMENEVGRAAVERGQLCERKNGRGVDTNRNWEVHWGFKEKDYDPKEEFPGTRPFRHAHVRRNRQRACRSCHLHFHALFSSPRQWVIYSVWPTSHL